MGCCNNSRRGCYSLIGKDSETQPVQSFAGRCSIGTVLAVAALVVSPSVLLPLWWNLGPRTTNLRGGPIEPSTSVQGLSAFPPELYARGLDADAPCYPRGIHLAQATNVHPDDDTVSLTVSLLLDRRRCRHAVPTVVYGPQQGGDDHSEEPTNEEGRVTSSGPLHFEYTSSKRFFTFYSSWIHHIQLPKLAGGGQKYWYKVVVDDERKRSPPYRLAETRTFAFATPPKRHVPTALAFLGDLGQTENSTKTMERIYQAAMARPDDDEPAVSQLLIAGDISYADGDPNRWMSWLDLMEPLLRTLPVQVLAGNHEASECNHLTGDVFVPYENYFRNPNRIKDAVIQRPRGNPLRINQCASHTFSDGHYKFGNSFYSYQHGMATIVALNSYTDVGTSSAQYKWLVGELEAFDRSVTPWLIVSFHAPYYSTFLCHADDPEVAPMKDAMEDLFIDYGVNFVVSGHVHGYMRTRPLFKDQVDPAGPVYLILGASGNHEGHCGEYRNPKEPEEWVAARDSNDFGYGHLLLRNESHARFQRVRDGVSDLGLDDSVWVSNAHI